jgi:tetraacyldisaccharide 4'-kinase
MLCPQGPCRERFLGLIRGRHRDPVSAGLRLLLWLASLVYGLAVRLRNLAFNRGWRVQRVSVPVISVGNLTVGGTGKTPCVEFIARFLRQHDFQVALLSRGYGSEQGCNDEALVLEENLPDVPHLQGRERVALAQIAVDELESQVLLLDDGFQHRWLARDLDIVLIDATDPFGGEHLLPRGLLREPITSLRRADAVLLTRCDQVEADVVIALRDRITRIAPGKPLIESVHQPQCLVNAAGDEMSLHVLRERPVFAFCGIGNPSAFQRTLTDLGCQLVDFQIYPDHHAYNRPDVDALRERTRHLPQEAILITTQKDLVKLRICDLAGRPLWAVRIGLAIHAGQADLEALCLAAVRRTA